MQQWKSKDLTLSSLWWMFQGHFEDIDGDIKRIRASKTNICNCAVVVLGHIHNAFSFLRVPLSLIGRRWVVFRAVQ